MKLRRGFPRKLRHGRMIALLLCDADSSVSQQAVHASQAEQNNNLPCFLRGFHGLLGGAHGLQLLLGGLVPGSQLLYGREVRARRSKLAQVAVQSTPAGKELSEARLGQHQDLASSFPVATTPSTLCYASLMGRRGQVVDGQSQCRVYGRYGDPTPIVGESIGPISAPAEAPRHRALSAAVVGRLSPLQQELDGGRLELQRGRQIARARRVVAQADVRGRALVQQHGAGRVRVDGVAEVAHRREVLGARERRIAGAQRRSRVQRRCQSHCVRQQRVRHRTMLR